MQEQGTQPDFTGQHVYVGLDVSTRSWKVAVYLGEEFQKRISQVPDSEHLVRFLQRRYPGAEIHVVFEAGYCGFWIHEQLVRLGAHCIVVNPADVPTRDKERRHKNDRVDAGKLGRSLAKKELNPIYVPSRVATEDRTLIRTRMHFVRKQTRTKNQIKALLAFYGCQQEEEQTSKHWSRRYIRWIESIAMQRPSGDIALRSLIQELLFHRKMILDLTRQIRLLSREEPYKTTISCLCTVPGIGLVAAMTLLMEIMTIERFKTLGQLASYVGLVPGEHSSGDQEHTTGMVNRKNSVLRHIIIECAWMAQREDPALAYAFGKLTKRMPKNEAIVRIARKLLNRVRFVMKNRQPYVCAVLQGA
jgi:transposase